MKAFNKILLLILLGQSLLLGQEEFPRSLPSVDISQIWHSSDIPEHSIVYDTLIDHIINQTNLDSLITYVRILSGEDSVWVNGSRVRIQHRVSNWGNDLAADYLKQQLETYGLEVHDQRYSANGRNIYAIQPGFLYPQKHYIICAHYDAVDYYGADDNASGVAAVLEAARILSNYYFKYTLVYALWDEEEIGLIGSQYYASQAWFIPSDIQGVLNMDMIGWDGNNDGLLDIHTRDIANSNSLANLLMITNSLYNLPLSPVTYNPGTWQSDHSSFWNYNYSAVLHIEAYYGGDLNPYYHTSADRIDKFNLSYFHNMSKLSIGTISTIIEVTDDTLVTLLTSVVPDKGYQNTTLEMEIYGYNTHFADSLGTLDVWLSRASETIPADSIIVQSNTLLTAYFSISLTATLDLWDINVETSIDGILTKAQGFEILPPPNIINVPADIDSIQGGIDLAKTGDTVLVQPGTYVENINFNGKAITVASQFIMDGDTNHISNTIIDGGNPSSIYNGSVVYFISGEDSTSVLCGFKITNGSGTLISGPPGTSQTHGGGIFCNNNSSPTLMNLIVSDNVALNANGAGIACENNSHPKILNVMITRNNGLGNVLTNDGSAGIYLASSSPMLKDVSIVNNKGLISGGICCWGSCNPVLINVTIGGNEVVSSAWTNDIAEIVIAGNSNPRIINSILWNDSLKEILFKDGINSLTIAYSDIQGGIDSIVANYNSTINWLAGNIDSDPMFVNAANGDYRLLEGSPGIDAGIQDTFLLVSGLNAIYIPPLPYMGSAPDMGAFESDPNNPITIIQKQSNITRRFTLYQNYPNPFNPSTTIQFDLPKNSEVTLKVFNILGEEVAMLVSDRLSTGSYSYEWDASNLASGVYLYKLQAGEYVETRKMVLMR